MLVVTEYPMDLVKVMNSGTIGDGNSMQLHFYEIVTKVLKLIKLSDKKKHRVA